jgi:hypothetical protein
LKACDGIQDSGRKSLASGQGGEFGFRHGVDPLPDGDAADHARFEMARNQADEFTVACGVPKKKPKHPKATMPW